MNISFVETQHSEGITAFAALDDDVAEGQPPRMAAFVLFGEDTRLWLNFYVVADYRSQGVATDLTNHIRAIRPGSHFHPNRMDADSKVAAWRLGVYPHPGYPENLSTREESERLGRTLHDAIAPLFSAQPEVW